MPPPKKTKKALPDRPRNPSYSTMNPPPKVAYMPYCVYPDRTGSETRTFLEGQHVCVRVNGMERSARFVRSVANQQYEVRFSRGVVLVTVPWYDVGILDLKGKRNIVKSTAVQKNLPDELESQIKSYLGGSLSSHRLTKRNKRVKRE